MRIITASLNFLFLFCIGLSWSDTQTCLLGYKSTFQKLAKRNNANHFKDWLGNWNGSTINIHPIPTLPLNIRYFFFSAKKIRYLFSVFQNQNGVFELEVSSFVSTLLPLSFYPIFFFFFLVFNLTMLCSTPFQSLSFSWFICFSFFLYI